jgi:hypothetical protein
MNIDVDIPYTDISQGHDGILDEHPQAEKCFGLESPSSYSSDLLSNYEEQDNEGNPKHSSERMENSSSKQFSKSFSWDAGEKSDLFNAKENDVGALLHQNKSKEGSIVKCDGYPSFCSPEPGTGVQAKEDFFTVYSYERNENDRMNCSSPIRYRIQLSHLAQKHLAGVWSSSSCSYERDQMLKKYIRTRLVGFDGSPVLGFNDTKFCMERISLSMCAVFYHFEEEEDDDAEEEKKHCIQKERRQVPTVSSSPMCTRSQKKSKKRPRQASMFCHANGIVNDDDSSHKQSQPTTPQPDQKEKRTLIVDIARRFVPISRRHHGMPFRFVTYLEPSKEIVYTPPFFMLTKRPTLQQQRKKARKGPSRKRIRYPSPRKSHFASVTDEDKLIYSELSQKRYTP